MKIVTFLSIVFLSACGSGDVEKDMKTAPVESSWYKPSVLATWQWQLSGAINTTYVVEIYDIDLFDSSPVLIQNIQAAGKKVICYFSGGSSENWREDFGDFLLLDMGEPLDGWVGERWLDIRSSNVRSIMRARLVVAQQKGCDGVEPDNMDGYANFSGFPLVANDQLDYNRFIATEAHALGLSVGLKNDLDQVADLVDDFDFAVNEQCFEYAECELLAPFIAQNKPVFSAEYKSEYVTSSAARGLLCTEAVNQQFSTLVLAEALDDSIRFSCH